MAKLGVALLAAGSSAVNGRHVRCPESDMRAHQLGERSTAKWHSEHGAKMK